MGKKKLFTPYKGGIVYGHINKVCKIEKYFKYFIKIEDGVNHFKLN